ncbi:265_t:CDS:2, partial [Acaulospora morrowiae]
SNSLLLGYVRILQNFFYSTNNFTMPKAKTAKKATTGACPSKFLLRRALLRGQPTPSSTLFHAFFCYFYTLLASVYYSATTELPKVKAENPNLEHKAAFKLVAERWKNSSENPK